MAPETSLISQAPVCFHLLVLACTCNASCWRHGLGLNWSQILMRWGGRRSALALDRCRVVEQRGVATLPGAPWARSSVSAAWRIHLSLLCGLKNQVLIVELKCQIDTFFRLDGSVLSVSPVPALRTGSNAQICSSDLCWPTRGELQPRAQRKIELRYFLSKKIHLHLIMNTLGSCYRFSFLTRLQLSSWITHTTW